MEHVTLKTPRGNARGMLHIGEGRHPVLIVHGYFGASRVGHARLYVKIANALVQKHACDVLRMDAVGVGESDGNYEDVTLTSFIDDFIIGVNWLTTRMNSDASPPIIIGHSMGANVALLMSEKFKWGGAVLIAPEVPFNGAAVDKLFTPTQLRELKRVGQTIRKGIVINSSFIEEIRKVSLEKLARRIKIPTFIIHGTGDELFDPNGAVYLSNLLSKSKFCSIEGADHNFLGPHNESILIGAILESLEWIRNHWL